MPSGCRALVFPGLFTSLHAFRLGVQQAGGHLELEPESNFLLQVLPITFYKIVFPSLFFIIIILNF